MSEDLKDILSNLSPEIDQETLLLYLQNKLSVEKMHEVEKKLLDNEFADDAAEGLQQFTNKEKLNLVVEQLNKNLKSKLKDKRKRRPAIHLREYSWIYLAVIILILLILISYFVIQRLQQQP